ncbi:hypothetical protein [Parvibaculum lavamentivorans]|nr:hypothetical protein [Parvibaculum lavamentivorans]
MTIFVRRFRAVIFHALVCGALCGLFSMPAHAAFQGTPDAAIFADHFAVLEDHERALEGAPAGRPKPPPISTIVFKPPVKSLPPLPDIHETKGITQRILIEKSRCLGCAPDAAAAATGLPIGVFENALRLAIEKGWRAGYDEMRAAAPRATPPHLDEPEARRDFYLRYIRRIVHGWQVAVVHTQRANNRIGEAEADRFNAVLRRTLPPSGIRPQAPQRMRTGWVSDKEMDWLDRRAGKVRQPKKRLADKDAKRIAERFVQPAGKPVVENAGVEGDSNIIPFARIATGYADDMLLGSARAFLPEGTQVWSRTGGQWTLEALKQRVAVSGGAAWPLGEATKLGATMTWGRGWRDGARPWGSESLLVSPFISYAMSENVRLRAYGGAGYRTDHVETRDQSVAYGGSSLFSGASIEGMWEFGALRFRPAGHLSMSRLQVTSGEAAGEARSRGRATYKNGFTYSLPETHFFSKVEPFASVATHWTFDRIDREARFADVPLKSEFGGDVESGILLKALGNLIDARLATGIEDIGETGFTNYMVTGRVKFSF